MLAPEYEAVRHLLAAPAIAARTAPHIGDNDFDFGALAAEAETMSGGEALLVDVARELWLAEPRVGLWELVRRLDTRSFMRVLTALNMARAS